jgi:hypothetical protein
MNPAEVMELQEALLTQAARLPEGSTARDQSDDMVGAVSAKTGARGRRLLQSRMAQAL